MPSAKKAPTLESFVAGKEESVLFGQPDNLESICYLLNNKEPEELCSEVRRLVAIWQKSGPNLDKMLKDDQGLAARVTHGKTRLLPTYTGKGHLLWTPNPPKFDASSWKDIALTHFMDLIVNPLWHKLGGPCHRCEKYYVKKTSRQKTYCSRRCGFGRTAIETTRKRRQGERVLKLSRAQVAADNWPTAHTRHSWKDWVSNETKITVKWLTRAVNKEDLRAPAKEGAVAFDHHTE